jgi:hypothetical protein
MPPEKDLLRELTSSATPFLRITGAKREPWCRVMQSESDGRIGPWDFVADFDVLNAQVWSRQGEVLYFVTDAEGDLRLVGQSMSKLGGRWKTVPMYDIKTKKPFGRKALFHTSSWPAIEEGLQSNDPPPFLVSALFRPELEKLCRSSTGYLRSTLELPQTHLHRLSYHVETWICSFDYRPKPLWNKDKVPLEYRRAVGWVEARNPATLRNG